MASRNYHFKFNTERDKTYIERLDAQDNMQNYIRRLILSDIAADSLRDIIQLAPDPDEDPDEQYMIGRQDFYSRECEALNADADPDCCKSCKHWIDDKCYCEDAFRREYYGSEQI